MTPHKMESKSLTLGRRSIAANKHCESYTAYRSRISSLPSSHSSYVIPEVLGDKLKRSVSWSNVDFSAWHEVDNFKSTNQSIFDDNFQEHWVVDDGTYDLGKLFCV